MSVDPKLAGQALDYKAWARIAEQNPGLLDLVRPQVNKYVPHAPHPKQAAFLSLTCKEAMYGGSASGGKSDALLMASLQYVHDPNFAALVLRRTYSELMLENAILDRAIRWLKPFTESGEVRWSYESKKFVFPSGATVTFGYLEHQSDLQRYQGAEWNTICFDELTQFPEHLYTYMFSRLRKKAGVNLPLRMRSATNPGGTGSSWVYDRFLKKPNTSERVFIPANILDNPAIDAESYIASLAECDEVTRARMLYGDWSARPKGAVYPEVHDCVVPASTKVPEGLKFGGIDWGFRAPSVFLCGTLDANDVLWVWFERYEREGTVRDHARHLPQDEDVVWFADSADPEAIEQMRRMDFVVRKVDKSIERGVGIVRNRMQTGRLKILESCKATLQEVPLYRYRDERDYGKDEVGDPSGVRFSEKPVKENDHAADALRYMCVGLAKFLGHADPSERLAPAKPKEESAKTWAPGVTASLSEIVVKKPEKADAPAAEDAERDFRTWLSDHWWTPSGGADGFFG